MEFAADHLDRLLGKSLLDWLVHEGSVTENSDSRGSDQPEHSRERGGPQAKGNRDDEERGVELRRRNSAASKLEIIALELADSVHATNHEADDKEEQQVGEQAVDAKHNKDSGIVAREVAQVIVDSALDLAKVGRLGDALEVKELGNGSQVGEAR